MKKTRNKVPPKTSRSFFTDLLKAGGHLNFLASAMVALALVACGGVSATVRQAQDAAAAGRYVDAYLGYARAVKHDPNDADSKRHRDQLRSYAVSELTTLASRATAGGHYQAAHKHISVLRDIDRHQASVLAANNSGSLQHAADTAFAANRFEEAYRTVAVGHAIYPGTSGQRELLERVRTHYRDAASTKLNEKQYRVALKVLAVIKKHDPQPEPWLAADRKKVTSAWAGDVRAKAQRAERESTRGHALVLFARAFEIDRDARDAHERDRLSKKLRAEGVFAVDYTAAGHVPDTDATHRRVRGVIAKVPSVRLASGGEASAKAKLDFGKASCWDSHEQSTGRHTYLAGHRDEPNPVYALRQDELRNAQELVQRARRRFDDVSAKPQPRCDTSGEESALARASEAVDGIQAKIERLDRRIARTQRRLDNARNRQERRRLRERLREIKQLRRSTEAELARAQRARDVITAKLARERDRCRRTRGTDLAAAKRRVAEREQDVSTQQTALDGTPATRRVPVYADHVYPIRDVTRECRREVGVYWNLAWTRAYQEDLVGNAATSDRTFDPHPPAGLAGDPLVFPKSKEALLRNANATIDAHLKSAMADMTRRYYRENLALVLKQPVPMIERLDAALALALAGRIYLDDGSLKELKMLLHEHYEIDSLDVVIPT